MKKFWENPANATVVPQGAQVPESLRIANVSIAPATILAPMAGVTDTVFRRFIRNASFVRSAHDVMVAPEETEGVQSSAELLQEQMCGWRGAKLPGGFKSQSQRDLPAAC